MKKIIVKDITKKTYLVNYISNNFKSLPYSFLVKSIRNKDIKINGKRVNKDIEIFSGDILEIYIDDKILYNIPNKIQYYYTDDNIIIAYKPKNILSNKIKNESDITFEDLVKKDLNDNNIEICHRLDMNTDGLMIFSKNNESHNEILNAFKNNMIIKDYIAYVHNSNFEKSSDTLNDYLYKDSKTSKVIISDKQIKYSTKITTKYEVIEVFKDKNYAKLKVTLCTGKTHQIRAHLSYIDHPILGDSKYGINEINRKFKLKYQLLTAYKYSFNFDNNSKLKYLNNIIVELEKEKTNYTL
jgi:23S rRNA pseudouridine955/2504/2580 synthase